MLEIASGAGEHAVFLAGALTGVSWRPSDPDPTARESIAAWRAQAKLPNLEAPLALDAADPATATAVRPLDPAGHRNPDFGGDE